ncbi:antibiotic biosynthesis monooxygenase [Pyrenophora seminiperda CCB06]|uniref:Antibiotic biosynthesis monooxygenase n=1 Tax=Pyrenophora seminiperda CCB06 TaxID=1302712 RepID=A0A3M7LX93_9PLEO|nr:antibiotic biosynthesis monooxygenase [Pyrenophora seminiperda CCB06]
MYKVGADTTMFKSYLGIFRPHTRKRSGGTVSNHATYPIVTPHSDLSILTTFKQIHSHTDLEPLIAEFVKITHQITNITMSSPFDIMAILTPKPGKADRLESLISAAAQTIKDTEPGTLRFHLQRETHGDGPRFVVLETYADKAALETHVKGGVSQKMGKLFKEEDLLAKPMEVLFTKSVGGYASKL